MTANRVACALLAALTASAPAAARTPPITAADYQRAEKVLDYNLKNAVLNAKIVPHWIGTTDVFWYRRQTKAGADYWRMDAATGAKTPLFDAAQLAAAIVRAAPQAKPDAQHLAVASFDATPGGAAVKIDLGDAGFVGCDLPRYVCSPPATDAQTPPGWLVSPDRKLAVFARGDDLWLHDIASGGERRLTSDGEPHYSYAKIPDGSLASVPALRHPADHPPPNLGWLPDSRTLVGVRVDERAVENYPFVEAVPQDGSFRPKVYDLRLPFPGDVGQYVNENYLLDVKSGAKHEIALPKAWTLTNFALSVSGATITSSAAADDGHSAALFEVNTGTGEARQIASESEATGVPGNFNPMAYVAPDLRIVSGGKEAIWFSQADGWGHLYLYDVATGTEKRRITTGPWLVRDVVRVDEARRLVYFTATGREGGDPYLRRLYVASLDGDDVKLLTPEVAEHDIADPPDDDLGDPGATPTSPVSPSGLYFLDTYSTVATPPVTVLRATADGHIIATVETGDASAAYAAGWHAPQRFTVKAADGTTDIYGAIYFPPNYRKGRKYPVIDALYGGPQIINAPRNFASAVSEALNPVMRSSLAQLGFIVVTVDGRGTPGRSKAFHDAGYGNFADPQIADHIAGIQQLAARFGTLDLTRVGVYGHSFGGYVSAHAILSHPEFYKVAVSSAGPHDYEGFYNVMGEYLGPPDYGNGSHIRPTPQSKPQNWRGVDNVPLAANLRGHLMLVYGDMDENALSDVTLQMADALIKANKSFDLLYLPNRTHGFFRTDPYYMRRTWDYFVQNLLGATPPENYAIRPPQ
jgi:dipeptidyl-peptidase 4